MELGARIEELEKSLGEKLEEAERHEAERKDLEEERDGRRKEVDVGLEEVKRSLVEVEGQAEVREAARSLT